MPRGTPKWRAMLERGLVESSRSQRGGVLQSSLRVKHGRCRVAVVEPRDATIRMGVHPSNCATSTI